MTVSSQFCHIELIPQDALVNQVPLRIKKYTLIFEQFPFRLLILPTWNLLPITLEASDKLLTPRQPAELMDISTLNTFIGRGLCESLDSPLY